MRFGERSLFARDIDGMFELQVVSAAKPADGSEPRTKASGLQAEKRKLQRALHVDPDHASEGEKHRHMGDFLA